MKLSIGQAWSETKAVLAKDGGLIATVALALLVLPGALVGLAEPGSGSTTDPAGWTALLALISGLIGLAGQLAISRIAIGPQLTVGQAIATGFRRLPSFVASWVIWVLPFALILIAILAASGADFSKPDAPLPPPSLGTTLATLLVVLAFLVVAVHMLFTSPAAVDTRLGPIGLIKRSWALSKGHGLKLLGALALVLIVALVLVVGLGSAINSVWLLLIGDPAPWNVSALLVSLTSQLLNAVVSTGLAVLVARLYVQLNAAGARSVSRPDAGRH